MSYAAPFIRLYYNKQELTYLVEDFKYIYAEEEDELCEITIKTIDRSAPDSEFFQNKTMLQIIWGYIGGSISKARKIYLQEIKWQFDKDGLTGTLSCTEKAVSLKFTGSNKVYKGGNFLSIVNEVSQRHGIKAYLQTTETDAKEDSKFKPIYKTFKALPNETLDQYLIRQHDQQSKDKAEWKKKNPKLAKVELNKALSDWAKQYNSPEAVRERKLREKFQRDYDSGVPIDVEFMVKREMGRGSTSLVDTFKQIKNQPQGGKSDKQLLNTLGAREPNGPYIVDSRDDEIIIKKRNFRQKPYSSYTYGGELGNLISFTPESKNRTKQATGTNMQYGGWNPMNKNFFSGNANAAMSNENPTLAKFSEMLNFYRGVQSQGGGETIAGLRVKPGSDGFKSLGNNDIKIGSVTDRTQVQLFSAGEQIPITVNDKIKALQKTLDQFSNPIDDIGKNLYAPYNTNPYGAFQNASNARNRAALDKTPAVIQILGDPEIEVGIVITIKGVGKKYSGNYYIIKCTHIITKSGGFITEAELVREGHNIKYSPDAKDTNYLGKTYNAQVGVEIGPQDITNTRKIKSRKG